MLSGLLAASGLPLTNSARSVIDAMSGTQTAPSPRPRRPCASTPAPVSTT
jgi:hypothetical protein